MKLYERIENNNFDEIDRNRAIELIEGGNGHLVYNENYFKMQKENEELKKIHIQDNKHLDFIMEHSITVQKVKDKIEEILNNGEYRIIFEGDAEFPDEATCIDAQKYIKLEKLQELLEGRKENERGRKESYQFFKRN